MLGSDLAYLGRGEEGLAQLRQALRARRGDRRSPRRCDRAYVNLTDVLTMLGRPRESARLAAGGARGDAPVRDRQHRARREPDRGPARDRRLGRGRQRQRRRAARASPRTSPTCCSSSAPTLEIGRGDFDAARAHLEAARATLREDRGLGDLRRLRRRARPVGAPLDGRRRGRARRPGAGALTREAAQIRVWLCAKGLRAQAELAALARARRDADAVRDRLGRARKLLAVARRAAAEASAVTPNAAGWLALAEAEYERARGVARPESWSEAAATWERLERPPLAAYCRWRQAEALVAAGALPHRGERAAPGGARRRGPDRSTAPAPRARAARPARAARSRAAGRGAARRQAGPRGDPRPDAARGGGSDPRRPRLHQPRDRRDARHQRQDRQRPRLAHPAQARRAEPARSGRDRAPPRPAARRAARAREVLTRARSRLRPGIRDHNSHPRHRLPNRARVNSPQGRTYERRVALLGNVTRVSPGMHDMRFSRHPRPT